MPPCLLSCGVHVTGKLGAPFPNSCTHACVCVCIVYYHVAPVRKNGFCQALELKIIIDQSIKLCMNNQDSCEAKNKQPMRPTVSTCDQI